MPGTYRISAKPLLHSEGEYKGKLKRVIFTAASPAGTREWFANNCGQFETALSRIMPASVARVTLAALMQGNDVELPGMYKEEEFERGFLFEWSPVYLVVPPPFVPEAAFS
jgi:hypothetical protein